MNIKKTRIWKLAKRRYEIIKNIFPEKSAAEKEYERENEIDRKKNLFLNPVTEYAIAEFKKQKGVFNDWALTESSIRCFLYYFLRQKHSTYHICEFGSGQSTVFFSILSKYIPLFVTSYEHDPQWAQYLNEHITNKNIAINSCELMQINEESRKKMFLTPAQSKSIWKYNCNSIDIEQYKNPILINGFYNIENDKMPSQKIDAIVLDGPHGNGRTMCFPLFYNYIENGTVILLDDYHHYPFLEDLNKLFDFDILEKRRYTYSNKGWVVLKITGKTSLS
jgi:hypothetical protein